MRGPWIHRLATDGLTTICGLASDVVDVAPLLEAGRVTCPACGRNATTSSDPAYVLMQDGVTSTTDAPYRTSCYICRDPEFAAMGLPLCKRCTACGGHVPADDIACDDCGHDEYEAWLATQDPTS